MNEPDSVLARDERRRARHRAEGHAAGNLLSVPDEKEILDDAFLRDHCLETSFSTNDETFAVRFRPVAERRDGTGIRGTVWMDAGTFLIHRMDVDYLRGGRPFASSTMVYGDVAGAGGTLRLPVRGSAALLRPAGAAAAMLSGATVAITYEYAGFQAVRPE